MRTIRRATTQWKGAYSEGAGKVSLASSQLGPFEMAPAVTSEAPYGQTSPMELLAAAHASCVCGMLAWVLEKSGHPAEELQTSAEVELETTCGVTAVRLAIRGVVPGYRLSSSPQRPTAPQRDAPSARRSRACPLPSPPTSLHVKPLNLRYARANAAFEACRPLRLGSPPDG